MLDMAPAFMERAIGKKMRIRSAKLPRNVTVEGVIIAVEPARFLYNGRSVFLNFRITLQAGLNKTNHYFEVRKLPQ